MSSRPILFLHKHLTAPIFLALSCLLANAPDGGAASRAALAKMAPGTRRRRRTRSAPMRVGGYLPLLGWTVRLRARTQTAPGARRADGPARLWPGLRGKSATGGCAATFGGCGVCERGQGVLPEGRSAGQDGVRAGAAAGKASGRTKHDDVHEDGWRDC